jgi:citrate synthase
MQFKTSITDLNNGNEIIRGYTLAELMAKKSFADTIYLLLRGVLPNAEESRMFESLLVAAIDHGPGTVSALTSRIVASSKTSVQAAVAAGILSMGERHGGAVGAAAEFFVEHASDVNLRGTVQALKDAKVRIPGYGHAILTVDHRIETLFAIARETGVYGRYSALAEEIGKNLNAISSKEVPLNVDGAMAAILLDLGFEPDGMTGLFIIARVPGLIAHTLEERASDAGLRRLDENDIIYDGQSLKNIV